MNSCRILDTKLFNNKGNIATEIFCKTSKQPVHWSSRVPKQYKRKAVMGDLHRSKRRSSNFEMEIKAIQQKFQNTGYPPKSLSSVISQFLTPKKNDLFIAARDLFEESQPFILDEILDCEEKYNASKYFIKTFEAFTIKWITRKIKSLFKVKRKVPHPSSVIYRGKCSCGEEHFRKR